MKKAVVFLGIALSIVFTGCVQPQPVEAKVVPLEKEEMMSCAACEEKEPKVDTCAKETKVVHYVDVCKGNCGFPVTVRKQSNCCSRVATCNGGGE